jgi:hypothetical protein
MEDLDAVDDTPAVLVLFSSLKAALPALEKLQTPAVQENSSASRVSEQKFLDDERWIERISAG